MKVKDMASGRGRGELVDTVRLCGGDVACPMRLSCEMRGAKTFDGHRNQHQLIC